MAYSQDSQGLWDLERPVGGLYVAPEAAQACPDSGTAPTWHLTTNAGEVFCGPVDRERAGKSLPIVTQCLLYCFTDLAADFKPGPPLLLAHNRVFRWNRVPWHKVLLP